jgi:hypothetical protein
LLACVSAVVCVLLSAPAFAAPPLVLDAGQVTDDARVLDAGSSAAVDDALERLNREHNVQLFVVFVDSFDGIDSQDWTNETAEMNGLGLNDILLAVAVVDRQYAWSADQDFVLSDDELEQVAADSIEPALQDDDWAEAVVAGADGYRAVLNDRDAPGSGPATGVSGGASLLGCCLPLGLVAIVGGIAAFFIARRRRGRGPAAPSAHGEPDMKELETTAGRLLVQVDDALRASEQELGFAEAEFGADAVVEYRTALADSKKDVAEAFRIQQGVYDSEPEDEPTRREMLQKIIALSEAADARLDEKTESFTRLRDVAGRVGEVLTSVSQRLGTVEGGLAAATATLGELKAAYLSSALGDVADDDVEAAELVTFARSAIEKGTAENAAGDNNAAAMSARAAEDAVAQAEQLLAAVEAARGQLGQALTDLASEVAALERSAATVASQGASELGPLADTARRVAGEARAALDAPPLDPVAQLAQIRAAAAQLDAALGSARDAAAQAEAARTAATGAIRSARDRIASAEAFIATRHGAVGTQARSSLGEAQARLARAEQLVATDASAAMTEAQSAQQYAESASRYAQSDVVAYDRGSVQVPQPQQPAGGSGEWMRTAGAAAAGAVLSGVLRDAFSGGSAGGFGGSAGRRSGGGSMSSSARSAGSRSSSTRSSGTRSSSSRRSGGGRF